MCTLQTTANVTHLRNSLCCSCHDSSPWSPSCLIGTPPIVHASSTSTAIWAAVSVHRKHGMFVILFSLIVKSDEPDSHRVTNLIAHLARSVASAASASRRRKPPTAPREPPSSPSPYPRPHVDSAGAAPRARRWPSGCSPHSRPLPRPGIESAPSTTRKSFVDVCMYVRTYVRSMYVCMYVCISCFEFCRIRHGLPPLRSTTARCIQ
jgi:hypothetical protein